MYGAWSRKEKHFSPSGESADFYRRGEKVEMPSENLISVFTYPFPENSLHENEESDILFWKIVPSIQSTSEAFALRLSTTQNPLIMTLL